MVFCLNLQVEDSAEVLADKTAELSEAIRHANHLVVYTGAGVSTVRDGYTVIPQQKGPN